jgi:hypothetical protein
MKHLFVSERNDEDNYNLKELKYFSDHKITADGLYKKETFQPH